MENQNQHNVNNKEINLFNEPNEAEINLSKKLFYFESDYDPYGFADSIAEQGEQNYLANTVQCLRNKDERQNIINYLQEIIDNADKAPLVSTEYNVSRAKQFIKDISGCYDREIIDTTKSTIMEENSMENQKNQQTQETTAKYFNKHSYGEIENKAFLSCDSKTAYAIGQKAQEQGIVFSTKFDGNKSVVVVDGIKNKAFVDAVKAEFTSKVHTADDPTFFNKKAYKDIENKTFLNTDAKTAYAIGQKAQEQGIVFSAKFDGDKSAVTVDGVKDKAFVDAVKAEFNIADKINEVEQIAEKIQDAIDNGELDIDKDEQSRGQEI